MSDFLEFMFAMSFLIQIETFTHVHPGTITFHKTHYLDNVSMSHLKHWKQMFSDKLSKDECQEYFQRLSLPDEMKYTKLLT